MNDIVILSAARTPIGSFQGARASVSAPQLGAAAMQAALTRAGVAPDEITDVLMGNVLQAGAGQAPARQAALHANTEWFWDEAVRDIGLEWTRPYTRVRDLSPGFP